MAATVIVIAANTAEENKKAKSLQYLADNTTPLELERLEQMAKSENARGMLNDNWPMLKSML